MGWFDPGDWLSSSWFAVGKVAALLALVTLAGFGMVTGGGILPPHIRSVGRRFLTEFPSCVSGMAPFFGTTPQTTGNCYLTNKRPAPHPPHGRFRVGCCTKPLGACAWPVAGRGVHPVQTHLDQLV